MPRYKITLAQTVVEVAFCEVEAADEAGAILEAGHLAQNGELDFEAREFGATEIDDITRLED